MNNPLFYITNLLYIPLNLYLLYICYSMKRFFTSYETSSMYFRRMTDYSKKNTPMPKKLTILPMSYKSSSSCSKRLVCHETIVELSEGSKISRIFFCLYLPFGLNRSNIYYIFKSVLKSGFNCIFWPSKKKKTQK